MGGKSTESGMARDAAVPEVSVYVQKDVGGLPYVGAELCDAAGEERPYVIWIMHQGID